MLPQYSKCSKRGIEPKLTDTVTFQKEKLHILWSFSFWNKLNQTMVRERGLEPPQDCSHYHLKVARLPFRHSRTN